MVDHVKVDKEYIKNAERASATPDSSG